MAERLDPEELRQRVRPLEPQPLAHAGPPPKRLGFAAAQTDLAADARARLVARYGDAPPEQAEVVVALGGDGFMLETLHQILGRNIAVFGMNCGSVGFLMNAFSEDDLPGRIACAQEAVLYPLRMCTTTMDGGRKEALALNEVEFAAPTPPGRQAARHHRRQGAVAGADLRRHPDFHPGRLDGVQPIRARSDRSALRQSAAADPAEPVPPPPLARRALAEYGACAVRGFGSRQASRRRRRRLHRGARCHCGVGGGGPFGFARPSCSTRTRRSRNASSPSSSRSEPAFLPVCSTNRATPGCWVPVRAGLAGRREGSARQPDAGRTVSTASSRIRAAPGAGPTARPSCASHPPTRLGCWSCSSAMSCAVGRPRGSPPCGSRRNGGVDDPAQPRWAAAAAAALTPTRNSITSGGMPGFV